MTDERTSDDVKRLWRDQRTEEEIVTLEDIRKRAKKFQRRVRNRNLREYVAAAVTILLCAWFAWIVPGWMTKLGLVLSMGAVLLVVWQLHRRGAAAAPPPDASAAGLLEFHRRELLRQRELLRGVWLWYLAPFAPGAILTMLGRYYQFHVVGRTLAMDHLIIVLASVIVLLVFAIVWLVNMLAAARLEKKIAELDGLQVE